MTKNYNLINYFDVWGNEIDGYWVNNQRIEFTDLVIADEASDKDIVKYLYDIGFLNSHDMRRIIVDSSLGDYIEIYAKKGMKPVCALELNYN